MLTTIRRSPANGSRPCAARMLSTTSTSPCRHGTDLVSAAYAARMFLQGLRLDAPAVAVVRVARQARLAQLVKERRREPPAPGPTRGRRRRG